MGQFSRGIDALLSRGEELRADNAARRLTDYTLEVARELQADFHVCNERVICNVRGITGEGDSYVQAAMVAIHSYDLAHRSAGAPITPD